MHVAHVWKNHRPLQKPTQRKLGGLTRRNGAILWRVIHRYWETWHYHTFCKHLSTRWHVVYMYDTSSKPVKIGVYITDSEPVIAFGWDSVLGHPTVCYSTEILYFCSTAGTSQCHFLAFSHIQIWRTHWMTELSIRTSRSILLGFIFCRGLLVADLFFQRRTLLLSLGQRFQVIFMQSLSICYMKSLGSTVGEMYHKRLGWKMCFA
jgi:hypothetical protein